MDVCGSAEDLAAAAAEAAARLGGPIDVLVYAAGVGQRGAALETPAEDHARLMATHCRPPPPTQEREGMRVCGTVLGANEHRETLFAAAYATFFRVC